MLIWLLSAGNFVIGMGAFVVIGLLEPLADGLGVGPGQAGALLTIYAAAYAVGSPLGVALTGGVPRRSLLTAAMAVFGLAAAASAVAPTWGVLAGVRVLAALGAGLYTPVAAAVAAGTAAPDRRGKALANVFFGLTLAQVAGVPAGSFVAYSFGWQWGFAVVAVLALPVALGLWWRVPRELPFQPARLAALGAALRDPAGMVAVSFTTIFLGGIYVLFTYFGPLVAATMGYGRDGITLAFLVFGLGAVIGNLAGGRMADRLGPARTLALLVAAQAALMPLFALLPMPGAVFFGLVLLWSVAGWSFHAPQQVRLVVLTPERQNVILALNAAAIYVGAALGSWAGGLVVAGPGLPWIGPAGAAVTLLAGGALWLSARLSPRPPPAA